MYDDDVGDVGNGCSEYYDDDDMGVRVDCNGGDGDVGDDVRMAK